MKQIFIAAFCCLNMTHVEAQGYVNVMTFNIRYDNAGDSLNSWQYTKDNAVSQILFHKVHLLGVQEALYNQLGDLIAGLKFYKYAGVGRADGKQKGEFPAILYDTTRLRLIHSETFWLAEHPNIAGEKGWDAAIERIVTWAKFQDKKTKKFFYHFNTHFDHIGKIARRESARLLLQRVKEIGGNAHCIITGDFNSMPSDEPIEVMTNKSHPDHLFDTKEAIRYAGLCLQKLSLVTKIDAGYKMRIEQSAIERIKRLK
ncbi:MAG: endonuclease/exonuclease/phosphatase family protein [Ginsengibacter sp.]